MLGLYEYETASYEECIDDLRETIEILNDAIYADSYDEEPDVLEKRGIRIQNIAQRLEELRNDNNDSI